MGRGVVAATMCRAVPISPSFDKQALSCSDMRERALFRGGRPWSGFFLFFPINQIFPPERQCVSKLQVPGCLVSQHGGLKSLRAYPRPLKPAKRLPPVGLAGVAPSAWLRYNLRCCQQSLEAAWEGWIRRVKEQRRWCVVIGPRALAPRLMCHGGEGRDAPEVLRTCAINN